MIDARRLYDACFHATVVAHKLLLLLSPGLPWLLPFGSERGRQILSSSAFVIANTLGERGSVEVCK
jgi:hypothetical protein